MAKDTYYFSHDYNARQDDKIKLLMRKHGVLGYGIWWCIVEDLYNNANALRLDCEGIAYDLRTDCETVKSIINDFDLFVFDGEYFGSRSIETRLNERNEKSRNAKESADRRWEKVRLQKEIDANALRTQSEGNAINKGKEIKEKKEKEINIPSLIEFLEFCKLNFEGNFKEIEKSATLKYKAWIENKWRTGKNSEIKNWKSTLLNTIPHLQKEYIKTENKVYTNEQMDYTQTDFFKK